MQNLKWNTWEYISINAHICRQCQTHLVDWLQLKLGHLDCKIQIGYCSTPEWRKRQCYRDGLQKKAGAKNALHFYQPIVIHARPCRDRVKVRSNLSDWMTKIPSYKSISGGAVFVPTAHHNDWVIFSSRSLGKDIECLGYCNTCLRFNLDSLTG